MNFIKKLSGINSTTGLDIGTHSIKLAKISHQRGKYVLDAVGIKDLKNGILENGEIKDRDGLIETITTLTNQCGSDIIDVVISMSGHGILSEKFTFKIDPNENVEEVILWEAGQRSPFDVDDITLDYKIIRKFPDKNEVEVMIVGAKNQIMQNYIDLLYDAGLRPVIVDVDAFAIYNCYTLESSIEDTHGITTLINIGHSLTSITFIKDGLYHSYRDITTAGDFFVKTIQRNLNVSMEDAVKLLKGTKQAGSDEQLLKQTIDYACDELSSGIELAFSFFKNSEKSDKIDRIILSGGGSYIPNVKKILETRHNTTVKISNPLSCLSFDNTLFGSVNPQKITSFLTVAIGLALRKVQ